MVPRHVDIDQMHDENHEALQGLGRRARVTTPANMFEPKPRLKRSGAFLLPEFQVEIET
jgi:hypothetical protein